MSELDPKALQPELRVMFEEQITQREVRFSKMDQSDLSVLTRLVDPAAFDWPKTPWGDNPGFFSGPIREARIAAAITAHDLEGRDRRKNAIANAQRILDAGFSRLSATQAESGPVGVGIEEIALLIAEDCVKGWDFSDHASETAFEDAVLDQQQLFRPLAQTICAKLQSQDRAPTPSPAEKPITLEEIAHLVVNYMGHHPASAYSCAQAILDRIAPAPSGGVASPPRQPDATEP